MVSPTRIHDTFHQTGMISCSFMLYFNSREDLHDLLADSDVYASSTVDQMLAGKQFNRAVCGLTLTYEACMDLWVTAFFKWCAANNYQPNIPMLFWEKLTATQTAFKDEHTSIAEMLMIYGP